MANESAKSETPKVFAEEDLTGDGGVKKKIVKEGEGWRTPEKGYEVKINFVGKLENGTIFDSNAEKGEYIFKLGLGEVVKGLDKAISQMKKGEIALLTVQPAYGYEETGHGDKVPPNAILHYEVELIGWIEIKDVSPAKDGGIQKKIVKDGEGWESPNEDSKVKVSYKITLENGTVLHEKKDVEYICGDEDIPIAVDYAVQSMKKGEKGLVTVQPKYISHTTGFEVPKDQPILYELELVDFIKEKSSWDMTFEEKLEAAKKRKNEGNELFAKEKYARALKKYAKALEFFQYDSTLKPEDQAKAKEIKIPCYLNSAASNIKEKDFKKAVENATKVVDIDKNNVKAYYRRGVAYSELDEWENARKDFETALNIDPANKDVKREMIKLKKKIADQDKKDRQLFGGIFDKMAETRKQEEKKESAKQ